jgi:O-antigen/teichoic acid export membrane protein
VLNWRVADAMTGWFLGPTDVGYLRAGGRFFEILSQISVAPFSAVTLSSLSSPAMESSTKLQILVRQVRVCSIACCPLFFGIGAVSTVFIEVMLGAHWSGAAPAFEILGPLMVPGLVNYFFGPAMIAAGRQDIVMRRSVAQIALCLPLLYLGSFYGLAGILVANLARASVVACFNLWALSRFVGMDPVTWARAVAPAITASASMWIAVRFLSAALDDWSPVVALMGLICAGAAIYVGILFAGEVLGLWSGHTRSLWISTVRNKGRQL